MPSFTFLSTFDDEEDEREKRRIPVGISPDAVLFLVSMIDYCISADAKKTLCQSKSSLSKEEIFFSHDYYFEDNSGRIKETFVPKKKFSSFSFLQCVTTSKFISIDRD